MFLSSVETWSKSHRRPCFPPADLDFFWVSYFYSLLWTIPRNFCFQEFFSPFGGKEGLTDMKCIPLCLKKLLKNMQTAVKDDWCIVVAAADISKQKDFYDSFKEDIVMLKSLSYLNPSVRFYIKWNCNPLVWSPSFTPFLNCISDWTLFEAASLSPNKALYNLPASRGVHCSLIEGFMISVL